MNELKEKGQAFKDSAIEWQRLVQPEATAKQYSSYLLSELDELKKATKQEDKALELADCVWVLAILESLPTTGEKEREARKFLIHDAIAIMGENNYADTFAFDAVQEANYAKITDIYSGSVDVELYCRENLPKAQNARLKELPDRRAVIIADDMRDPSNPQLGKIMKPKGWKSAKEIYLEKLKNKAQ
jgi:hypothetical protein